MKISVIIPVYNNELYLKKCLNSIVDQTLKDIEILCVDDGSTDQSHQIIEEFSMEDERIQYIKMVKNSGSGPARNKGLEIATGEYVSFVDSDDFIMKKTAYKELYNFATRKHADMVSANIKVFRDEEKLQNNQEENTFKNSNFTREIKEESVISPQNYGVPCHFQKNLYKKSFLDKHEINYPSYLRGQDHVFLAKVLVNVALIYCYPLKFYAYKLPSSNKIDSNIKERDYIQHFKDVFNILKSSGFRKTYLEYEDRMYKFLIEQNSSNSLEENIKAIFGDESKFMEFYKLQKTDFSLTK